MSVFRRATRSRVPLKLALAGPSGSGKTLGALRMATGLSGGSKIGVIDTENESASLYACRFDFAVLNIHPPFTDTKFLEALHAAKAEHFECVVVDTLSHLWLGTLDYKAVLDSKGGNSYTNWNQAGKKFSVVLDEILHSQLHVIITLRTKMDYVLETDIRGRQVPRKVGLAPVMRDGIEYEFSVVFDLDHEHEAAVTKDRTGLFDGQRFPITEQTGIKLREWLESSPVQNPVVELLSALSDIDAQLLQQFFVNRSVISPDGSVSDISPEYATRVLNALPKLQMAINEFRQNSNNGTHCHLNPNK
jgi:hypothetical protein